MIDWIKANLVDHVKQCWKWLSVQLAAAIAIAPMIYQNSDAIQQYLPTNAFRYIMSAMGILVIIGRIWKQEPATPVDPSHNP